MKLRVASLLTVLLISAVMGCKKTDDPISGIDNTNTNATVTPTSMVGTWKVAAFMLSPTWSKTINGTTERYSDYVQYLKRINETCLTDVVWTFTEKGGMSTNMNSLSTCGYNGPNSTFIVNYLVEPGSTYVEGANQVALRGADNITGLIVGKTYAAGNLVNLQWKDERDISNEAIPTTYTLVLKKQ